MKLIRGYFVCVVVVIFSSFLSVVFVRVFILSVYIDRQKLSFRLDPLKLAKCWQTKNYVASKRLFRSSKRMEKGEELKFLTSNRIRWRNFVYLIMLPRGVIRKMMITRFIKDGGKDRHLFLLLIQLMRDVLSQNKLSHGIICRFLKITNVATNL